MNELAGRQGGDRAGDRQRLFVALWPTPDVRRRLSAVAHDLAERVAAGRRVEASNLHLTLAFIGSLESDRVLELARQVSSSLGADFEWIVDRVGHFAGARVVWVGGPACAALLELAERTRAMLDSMRIAYDRKPFAPHVTVLRNVTQWPMAGLPIVPEIIWPSRAPALIRSKQSANGVVYVPIETA